MIKDTITKTLAGNDFPDNVFSAMGVNASMVALAVVGGIIGLITVYKILYKYFM